ncbi:MAG: hypothetical protein SNG38_07915 [Rikenellaceae bacterium]
MKKITTLIAVCIIASCVSISCADSSPKLKIYSSLSKNEIKDRLENIEWATATLESAHTSVDELVERHQADSTWILSRLQMYWKNHYSTPYINGAHYSRGDGNAPVPTVRFTGGRDWATDWATPKLEDIKPYMDYNDDQIYLQNRKKEGQPWEWVDNSKTAHQIESINVNIMERAMNSAFIYWLTGEEKYAKFAYDILSVYVDGIYHRNAPVTEIDHRSGGIVGLTSFEVIHEKVVTPMTLCYDFLFEYLEQQDADFDKMHTVFQKFADQIIKNGVATNNWNIFQARFITYLALLLDDDETYENGRGQQYYINFIFNENVERQKALRDVCLIYDQNTGIWNESPGYSTSVVKDLLEVLLLVDGVENNNILNEFSIVEKAALATFEYLQPNKHTTAVGDNAYGTLDYSTYESLLAFYRKYNLTEKENTLVSILNAHINEGMYNREKGSSLYKLFNYVDVINPATTSDKSVYSAAVYAPNVNMFIMRTSMEAEEGLMCVNAGTGFNHSHNNGVNMELYGAGIPMGVDKGRGSSYWVADHGQYYKSPISHNTVLIDGISENTSKEMAPDEVSKWHKMISCYPTPNQKDVLEAPAILYVDNQFIEQKTNSMQRRLNSIITTSPTTGYFVDIFRSRKIDGGDAMHEYFYHNSGQSLSLFDTQDQTLKLAASRDLTSANGKLKGYDYLSDKTEITFNGDFKGRFEVDLNSDSKDARMDVWMKGYNQRKLFAVKTPRILKGFEGSLSREFDNLTIPALIVRQYGQAWTKPFVAIYEPYKTQKGSSIESVEYFDGNLDDFVGIEVKSTGGRRDYILSNTRSSASVQTTDHTIDFTGSYSVISEGKQGMISLLMGNGKSLSYNGYLISSSNNETTVVINFNETVNVETNNPIELTLPNTSVKQVTCNGTTINGVPATKNGTEVMTFKIN